MKSKAPCDKRLEDLTHEELEGLIQNPTLLKKVLDRNYRTDGSTFVLLMVFWLCSLFWNTNQDGQIKALQTQCTCDEEPAPEVPENE